MVRYSYLWHREADAGRHEGSKDRPCAVVVAVEDGDGHPRVIVVPITHSTPSSPDDGVELQMSTKTRLGLDNQPSWVIVTEANFFAWPGPDLRFLPGQGPETTAYGFLPPDVFRPIRDRFVANNRARKMKLVTRTE